MGNVQQRKRCYLALVSLLLSSTSPAADGQIRLAGSGSARCSGRVEINYNGTWGTVCDDDWDLNDAEVVCRHLRCGTVLKAPTSAHFGAGTGQIWLDDIGCLGSERSLIECQHRGFGKHNCGHNEDAGVVCSGVPIRLVGSTLCSGRVEIYYNNAWGTVCDDRWDFKDAKVVCRELGCGTATELGHFGEGTGQIWLDEVGCSGSERSVTECHHRGFGEHDCSHSEDAGVVCSAILPKPSISMNPAGEVIWGQNVGITCLISTQTQQLLSATFILRKTSGSFRETQSSSTNSATFNIPKVNFGNEGSYQCQYRTRVSSQDLRSPLSDSVGLSVTVSLPKPSISMNPVGEVTWGQDVSITCSISTEHLGGTFILQQTSGTFRKTQTSTNSATFNIVQVDFDNEGSYQCQYQTSGSGRDFTSPLSDSVKLSVTVPLQQPSISLTSPDSGLVWVPEGAEVTRGYSFVFTCSTSSHYPGGIFSLTFSGSNLTDTKLAVNHSASFNFPVAEYEHQGNYSCVYEVTLSSRRFSSTQRTAISVIIKMPLLPLVSSLVAGGLLLLLLVLVVVCLVCKRRRRAKQPEALAQTQLALRVRNDYENNEDDEEDDYENADTMKKLKGEAGTVEEEESCNYEEPDSDEDHDYEEAGPNVNFIKAKEVWFSKEENREEEEEEEGESSDDENEYENITQASGEQTVDICGEHVDIYQNF